MTLVNLNKTELPCELSHEEVVALKDLDAAVLEATIDDLVDELGAENQAWACNLFILDVEMLHFVRAY